jgi:hypothetical protein
MKTCDVKDFKTRSDAVFGCLALDFVGRQLDANASNVTDVVSVITFSDYATTLLDREPMTNVLYNKLLRRMKDVRPRSHGNYLPAFDLVEEMLQHDVKTPECALVVLWLSDGRPSDNMAAGSVYTREELICTRTMRLAKKFGDRLSMFTIGVANNDAEFELLRDMANCAEECGAHGKFATAADTANLGRAVSSVATSLTATRTRLTSLAGGGGRTRRKYELERVERVAALEQRLIRPDDGWIVATTGVERWRYDKTKKNEKHPWTKALLVSRRPNTGISMHRHPLGEGAERIVFGFAEVSCGAGGSGVVMKQLIYGGGDAAFSDLVAKESCYVVDEVEKISFHRLFCKTQEMAADFARDFNRRVETVYNRLGGCGSGGGDGAVSPAVVEFLQCSVYTWYDPGTDYQRGVLVEQRLTGNYVKWNTNNGYVDGKPPSGGDPDKLEELLKIAGSNGCRAGGGGDGNGSGDDGGGGGDGGGGKRVNFRFGRRRLRLRLGRRRWRDESVRSEQ